MHWVEMGWGQGWGKGEGSGTGAEPGWEQGCGCSWKHGWPRLLQWGAGVEGGGRRVGHGMQDRHFLEGPWGFGFVRETGGGAQALGCVGGRG